MQPHRNSQQYMTLVAQFSLACILHVLCYTFYINALSNKLSLSIWQMFISFSGYSNRRQEYVNLHKYDWSYQWLYLKFFFTRNTIWLNSTLFDEIVLLELIVILSQSPVSIIKGQSDLMTSVCPAMQVVMELWYAMLDWLMRLRQNATLFAEDNVKLIAPHATRWCVFIPVALKCI